MPENKVPFPILRTKLHRPPIPVDFVPRPKLHENLNRYLSQPLTIVSAPAGYGKSTLISSWLESCECPGAWVSLDEGDSDLGKFLSYFLAAIQTIFPEFGKNTQALLNTAELPPLSVLEASLINELEQIDQNIILVLDDYHEIHDASIHKYLSGLLRHPSKSIHLVISSRRDPPLPIVTLRAQNQMTEIRASDLCFSIQETRTLFHRILEKEIDENTATLLFEKTEGWVTALRLAAISQRQQGNLDRWIDSLQSGNMFTLDYMLSEILSQLEPEIKDFLIKTSILDKLCGSLCDFVVKLNEPVCDGQAYLEWFQKVNLFTIPLDEQKHWFRYHYLFKELLGGELKNNLTAVDIDKLHGRAGSWLSQNDFFEESINHYMQAGDKDSAIQVFKTNRQELMNRVQWQALERLLKIFPETNIKKDAELLLSKCWVLIYLGKAFEAFELLPTIKLLLEKQSLDDSTTINLYSEHQVIDSWKNYNIECDFDLALQQSQSAIKNLHPENLSPLGIAWIFWAGSLQALGRYNEAITGVYKKFGETSNDILKFSLLLSLSYIYWLEADLSNLRKSAEHLGKIGQTQENLEASTNSQYFSGIVSYHQNELDRAVAILEQAFGNRLHTIGIHNINISCALALAYQETGQTEKAFGIVDQISEFAMNKGNPYFILIRKSVEAEINWRQGNEAEASRWAEKAENIPLVPFTNFFVVHIVLLKILIYQHSKKAQERALTLLKEFEKYLTGSNNRRFLIEIYALKALLQYELGNKKYAVAVLQKSLRIAEPGGFIRPYMDMGPKMANLLKELVKNNIMVGYVGKLLAAFREKGFQQTIRPTKLDTGDFIEKISKRELEILILLAQRMSNKEVADKLFISPETVKRHTITIYNKLNVHKRQEAVDKATALGLL